MGYGENILIITATERPRINIMKQFIFSVSSSTEEK